MDRKIVTAYIEVSFAVVIWGVSFVATKLALKDLEPVTVVWLRFAIGVIILGIFTYFRQQFSIPKKKDLAYFAALGFLGITFHQWLQSTGLVTSQASTTAWIVATTPVFIALLSWIFLREKISRIQIIGIALATIGVLLVVNKGSFYSLLTSRFGSPGDRLILISAVNWAAFSILSRYGLQRHQATWMMFYVMATGWIFISILFFAKNNINDLSNMTAPSFLGICFLGIFCSGLAYIAWYDGLKAIPASQVGAFLYIEPLVAILFAWFLLNERLLVTTVFGGLTILFGVWLVQRN